MTDDFFARLVRQALAGSATRVLLPPTPPWFPTDADLEPDAPADGPPDSLRTVTERRSAPPEPAPPGARAPGIAERPLPGPGDVRPPMPGPRVEPQRTGASTRPAPTRHHRPVDGPADQPSAPEPGRHAPRPEPPEERAPSVVESRSTTLRLAVPGPPPRSPAVPAHRREAPSGPSVEIRIGRVEVVAGAGHHRTRSAHAPTAETAAAGPAVPAPTAMSLAEYLAARGAAP